MTLIGDASTWSVTYDHISDNSRGVIYECNIFIIQTTDFFIMALEQIIKNRLWSELLVLKLHKIFVSGLIKMFLIHKS
jgi:hypothetical protein